MNNFYLFPDDLGDTPIFYKCCYLKKIVISDLSKEVWIVKISPRLPTWLADYHSYYESELLGLVASHKSWTLERVGEFGFVVDVLIIKDLKMTDKNPISAAFSRSGTGVISATPVVPKMGTK